jgi:hypothetical protein
VDEGTPIVVPQRAPILSAAFAPLLLLLVCLAAADLPRDFTNLFYSGLLALLGALVVLSVVLSKRRARRPSVVLLDDRLRAIFDGQVHELTLDGVSRVLFDRGSRWPTLSSGKGALFGEVWNLPAVYVFGAPYDDSYRERILGTGMTKLARWLEDPETPERGKVLLSQEIHTLGPRGVDAAQRTVGDWCQEHGIAFEVRASRWWWRARRRLRATTPTAME